MAYKKVKKNDYTLYINVGGKTLSVKNTSIIEKDGFVFKNLEGTDELLPYEDWRLDSETRAKDLANRLTTEEKIGLMIHTSIQQIPTLPHTTMYPYTYQGKSFMESGVKPWALTDQQTQMLEQDHIRHILAANYKDVETAVRWNNHLQEYAEKLPHGIPVNISSDPRNGVGGGDQEFTTSGLNVSIWPEGIGLAATFSPKTTRQFAEVASKEYRALGIVTALGPQIDLGTEPRWMRATDSMGCDSKLSTEMAREYCDGMQTTEVSSDGWGQDSVITMAKHWPGGGTGESGRDAHYAFGKYAVYSGNNFDEHLKPFTEGAFKLEGKTGKCAAVMPYYNIPWNQDKKYGENVGNSYNEYIIKDLLRETYEYEGVVCTDWGITLDMTPMVGAFMPGGKCHGVEKLNIAERNLKLILNGVDQIAGDDFAGEVLEAYQLGCEKYGITLMDSKINNSVIRILLNMFRVGLFEHPFLDVEESLNLVGCDEFKKAGFEAQLASVVMLKNKNHILPIQKRIKVYVPDRHIDAFYGFIRFITAAKDLQPISEEFLKQYFEPVGNPEEADAAIVFADSPIGNGGFDPEDQKNGGNGYTPISLQYRPYKAEKARKVSIAGGDPREESDNRNYDGKTVTTANESDLNNVIRMKELMKDKPVIVCIRMKHATVLSEMEPYADAILVDYGVHKSAVFDIITGKHEPTGLLPMLLPKDMVTVEQHCEDLAYDMQPYTDSEGHTYTFGFGLNYSGQIKDERTEKYTNNK